jgi:peptide deformylase
MLELNNRSALTVKSTDWDFNTNGDPSVIAETMLEIMKTNQGIGLAANQIGLQKRIFVMGSDSIPEFPTSAVIINPKILSFSEEIVSAQEGCLSFPGVWLQVKRSKDISVEYYDVKGNIIKEDLTDLTSRCFQHEYDHLDGVCFVDKVSRLKLELAIKKSRKKLK